MPTQYLRRGSPTPLTITNFHPLAMDEPGDSSANKGGQKVYPSRFWILGVFSFLAWFQCVQWSIWGPISESVDAAFEGWGSGTVAMMANWGTITFASCVAPMCWLMSTKGLRVGVVTCAVLVACATVARILPFMADSDKFFTVMCHIAAILNGIAGTLIMSAPPMIAAEWFPPKERTTATAVSQVLNQLGTAGSYLAPLLVQSPNAGVTKDQIKSDIKTLLYIYAAVGVTLLIAILVYFPTKPPTPPSVTSSVQRLNFKSSLKKLMRNRNVLLTTIAYSVCIAIPATWLSVLNYSLNDLGIDQDNAMWVGLTAVLVQGVTGLLVGRMTDLVYGHVKASLLFFMIISLACFYWFYLLTMGTIPVTKGQIFCSVVIGLASNFANAPLFFELAVERAYPCPEVIVAGLLTGLMNFIGLIFLFVFLIPDIGYKWVTYVLLSSGSLSIIPVLLVQEDYSRSNIDRNVDSPIPEQVAAKEKQSPHQLAVI
ncbi:solute carrier family 49 member 4 homolog isoform X2 [Procambarus clarkii]|uniref:solute carrier family 49 member 4 homolog isoform X2 n=2 Tax=Procambarus clarkii TaxID=6728 RepID=UPI0037441763